MSHLRPQFIAASLLLITFAIPLNAATIDVPADQPTIQEGIDAAADGDTVLVAPGTYYESLNFNGKAITLSSSDGYARTIIDGYNGMPVRFENGEGPDSVLEGFTVTRGSMGGIVCDQASPIIRNCLITENRAGYYPASGIYCEESTAVITGNIIFDNEDRAAVLLQNWDGLFSGNIVARNIPRGGIQLTGSGGEVSGNIMVENISSAGGGGIRLEDSSTLVSNNLVADNSVTDYAFGGGIYVHSSPQALLVNNTIQGNSSVQEGGGICCSPEPPTIRNCIIFGNTYDQIGAEPGGLVNTVTWCDVQGGYDGLGNIDEIPLFVEGPGSAHYLSQTAAGQPADSPCVDAGAIGSIAVGGSTRTDLVADAGRVDLGFHMPLDTTVAVDAIPASIGFRAVLGEAPPADQAVQVWNSGWGMLQWSAESDTGWLTLSAASGTSWGELDTVNVSVDHGGLGVGEHTATILVSAPAAGGPPLEIPVTLTVTAGVPGYSPADFRFDADQGGPPPPDQVLSVWNAGSGTLDWSVTDDAAWLTLVPASGQSAGEADEVTVSVNPAGLPPGFSDAVITLHTPDATPASVEIPVRLALSVEGVVRVPQDQPTIQAGIDAALFGNTVIVADGTWSGEGNRDLDFGGKSLVLESENGPAGCIIDCEGSYADPHRGFWFHNGEGPDSVVRGFRIRNGYASEYGVEDGGGILCLDASPTFEELVISSCIAQSSGGGILAVGSSSQISNCVIRDCIAQFGHGGGVGVHDCAGMKLYNCLVTGCMALDDYAYGGGLYSTAFGMEIDGCTFTGNSAGEGAGGVYAHSFDLIRNSILWDTDGWYPNLFFETTISYSDVYDTDGYVQPGAGNIYADPLFAVGVGGAHYLSQVAAGQASDSPCVDAGDPGAWLVDGTTRTDGVNDSGRLDMGYHYPGSGWNTVDCQLSCLPGSGTLPFQSQFWVTLSNPLAEIRRAAARIDVVIAGGLAYTSWRAGWTNLTSTEVFAAGWTQDFPALGALAGDNIFTLAAEDVTPPPYNQPPGTPSGDTDTAGCTVTGVTP